MYLNGLPCPTISACTQAEGAVRVVRVRVTSHSRQRKEHGEGSRFGLTLADCRWWTGEFPVEWELKLIEPVFRLKHIDL